MTDLRVRFEEETYNILWRLPETNVECIKWYKISVQNELTNKTEETSFTLKGWKHGTTYNISVQTVNLQRNESAPASILFTTKLPSVKNVFYEALPEAKYKLSWTAPVNPGFEVTNYTLSWLQESFNLGINRTFFEIEAKETCVDFEFQLVVNYLEGTSEPTTMKVTSHKDRE